MSSRVTVFYWNGRSTTRISRENYGGKFYALIPSSMKNSAYRGGNIVQFDVQNEYRGAGHPDTLLQKITIRWVDRAEEIFTSILTKKEHSKDCISGRPLG